MESFQTRIVTVSLEDLQSMLTNIVRIELEAIVTNPFLGGDFKEELWDRKKAANFLGISEQTLVKLVLEEKLVAQKSGRKYHFLKSSIMNFLRNVSKNN
jgi:excisionase family DNA binding protein